MPQKAGAQKARQRAAQARAAQARTAQPMPAATVAPTALAPEQPKDPDAARRAQESWTRVTEALAAESYARRPDTAWRDRWPRAGELGLGALGDGGGLRWRNALLVARSELVRMPLEDAPWSVRAPARALEDWIEAELLLVDALAAPMRDPAAYVEQATRSLRAVAEAQWAPHEERRARTAALLAALPAYLERARVGLLAPATAWVELALAELDDLEALAGELSDLVAAAEGAATPPRRRNEPAPPPRDEPWRPAIAAFRAWLLDVGASALDGAPTLDAREWNRLLELACGRSFEPGEIKATCLRDLARIEPAPEDEAPRGRPGRKPASKRLALRARYASTRALAIGREAQVLRLRPGAKSVLFATEEAARAGVEAVSIRPGAEDSLRVLLQLPHRSWNAARAAERQRELSMLGLTALGIRHGLAGEGLLERARLAEEDPLARLPVARVLASGVGLYAQDWIARVDWVANPLRENERLRAELDRQRGYEAARLLAALELHAEGISLAEAAESFRRRTGAGAEAAAAEALRAQRDPLHGVGYLGLAGLRALEEQLGELAGSPRRGLGLALVLVFRHPALRPSDLARAPRSALEIDR